MALYMSLPQGYHTSRDLVRKLNKSIYDLKQAPQMWNKNYSFVQSSGDHCLLKNSRR